MTEKRKTARLQAGAAAYYIGVSSPYMSKLVKTGRLKAYRNAFGQSEFDIVDLDRFLAERSTATGMNKGRPSTREAMAKQIEQTPALARSHRLVRLIGVNEE